MSEATTTTPKGQDAWEHATRYETIRRHVIEQSSFASRDGLVVLLRQGVAAWMDAWSMLPLPTRPTGTESTRPWPWPDGTSMEVVRVLVAMTLGHIQEVQA
jgi:hypothetical protein